MIWWLRVHAAPACLAALAACLLLAPALSSSELPLPSLFSGLSSGVPVPLVAPAVPACFLLYGLDRGPWETEASAARRVERTRVTALIAVGLAAVAVAAAESSLLDFTLGPAVARNLLGYVGVGLLVRRVSQPQYGPVAVAALPLVCALLGVGPGGRPYAWCWPLHGSGAAGAAAVAGVLYCAGLVTLVRPGRAAAG
ncbi:hypothetical protein RKE29_11695 [Streptomyces sp. B1866]|uniref:hypothetical protein n=1 Tax=Streptomyces sp. B1866 TaxID=3075431 RepID=UPI0028925DCE|nr:hypothetical protein [Streptomyces sp. B1866]MDT3397302.1 hypothetical protein [Streptomyces sp. B1866]